MPNTLKSGDETYSGADVIAAINEHNQGTTRNVYVELEDGEFRLVTMHSFYNGADPNGIYFYAGCVVEENEADYDDE